MPNVLLFGYVRCHYAFGFGVILLLRLFYGKVRARLAVRLVNIATFAMGKLIL